MAGKQLKIGDVKKTPLNLIQHEFYSYFPNVQKGVVSQPQCRKYYELREIPTQKGFEHRLVEVDYPITQDYVKSFASSADYRNDLNQAMSLPARGVNLGDVTSLQELCNMDLSAVQELQRKLAVVEAEKLKQAEHAQTAQQQTAQPAQAENSNGGVANG